MEVITKESLAKLTQEEIENLKIEIRWEIDKLSSSMIAVKEEYNNLKQEEVELRQKLADIASKKQRLKTALDKCGPTISRKRNLLKMVEDMFWKRRDGF